MVQFSLPSAKNYMDCVAILEYCKQEVIEEKCGGIDALNRMIDLFCEKADASFKFVNNDYTITLPGEDEVEDE